MKTYELIIPAWDAVVPEDWTLETATEGGEFQSAAGTTIHLVQGDRLRGGPEHLMEGMLAQGFLKELEEKD